MIFLLVKYRLKMLLSIIKGGRNIGRGILLAIAFLALAVMFVSFSIGIYEFAKMNPETGEKFIDYLTALSFHGMFLFMCFWGLSMAVFTIFFSNDLDLLLTLPLKPRHIYFYKIIEATFLNVRISMLFLIPILIILGLYYRASIAYYVMAVLAAIFLTAIPGAIGIIIASLLSRKIPKARLKGMLTVVGSLIGVALWAGFNRFSSRFSSHTVEFKPAVAKMAALVSSPLIKWLPSGWAYKATAGAAQSNWGQSLEFGAILAAVSIALTYLALKTISIYYSSGISEEVAQPSVAVTGINMGGSPLVAHIRRDLALFLREPGVITQSLIMLIFLFLYPFVFSQKGLDIPSGMLISPIAALFAAFFGGQLGSRLIPIEKLGFWQSLATPNGRNLTLLSKTIVGLVFVTFLSALVALAHYLMGRLPDPMGILLVVAFAWIGLALGIPVGVFFANFNWEHPRRMLKGSGGLFYAISMIAGGFGTYGLMYLSARFLSSLISPIIIVFLIAGALLVLSIAITAAKLMNMEWNPEV
jgi:ABC-2 type transport system permease protein